ncbi:hypothetical protein PN462_21925 [Spirulina sp. CS-785/01]|uniref:hypothetical protein n=1 Tax=Spirulina sp. CS-785/01 TaxID=3021716 RepID=UPI00232E3943|nr:hypothetical protein [Spirulina sp. CS-785/01]MDB9315788.1 hypothetical protein [Spirulina sp. CS-785/01]
MSDTEQTLQKIQKQAKKKIWITAILTFFVPFGGYLYTLRYTASLLAFIAMMLLISAEDVIGEDPSDTLYGFFIFGVAIENSLAVKKARDKAQEKGLQLDSTPQASLPNAKVQILKAGKQQSEFTVSDIVVMTELSPERVKPLLLEMEREDLIRSYNRDSDGAIVYKVI